MNPHYTLVVGTQDWSSWSLRPYLALTAAKVDFTLEAVRLRQPGSKAAILGHSPSGKVPLLKIDDGASAFAVWDSLAICETLAERHPHAGLWPADARARAQARAISAEMHSGFPNLRDQLSMDFARRLPLPDLRPETEAEIARIFALWENALAAGGEFLFGDFSIADCMYAPVVSRFVTYGVKAPPTASAYMTRVMTWPGMEAWSEAAQKEVDTGIA